MIRKYIIFIVCTGSIFFWNTPSWSRGNKTVNATATATVVEDLVIASEAPLDFGYIDPSSGGGTVTITPENTRATTGEVRASESFHPAAFTVKGMANHTYAVHAPSLLKFSVRESERDDKEDHDEQDNHKEQRVRELTVEHFVVYSVNAAATDFTGKLGSDGRDKLYLGATLIVPADAQPGIYSGTVPLTVSY